LSKTRKKFAKKMGYTGGILGVYWGYTGEPLWISGKAVKRRKKNEIKRPRVRSPPRATSLKKWGIHIGIALFCLPGKCISICPGVRIT
jgi:hypothetical protein